MNNERLNELVAQIEAEDKEIAKRNAEVNAQTVALEAVQVELAALAAKSHIPLGFYTITPNSADHNPKQDALKELLYSGKEILTKNGLSNFEVMLTEDGRMWIQDPNRTLDDFKPA